jgi:hypothetical protein
MRRGEFPLSALPAWCAFNDVNFFDVKVADIEGRGYGLVVERDLMNDADNVEVPTLLTIPKDLVLSIEAVEEYAKVDKHFHDLHDAAGHQVRRNTTKSSSLQMLLTQEIVTSRRHHVVSSGAADNVFA